MPSSVEAATQIVLTLGQVAGLASAVVGAAVAGGAWLFRALLAQLQERLTQSRDFETRLEERVREIATDSEGWRDLERSFLSLRAELPEKYVRREDYIRGQTVIEAKLDAISSELKVVQIQGAKSAH